MPARRRRHQLTIAALLFTLLATLAPPASAGPEAARDAIDRLPPGLVGKDVPASQRSVALAGGLDALTLAHDGHRFAVTLEGAASATIDTELTIVDTALPATEAAAIPTAEGVQILTVLFSPRAPDRFVYLFDGVTLEPGVDGTVTLLVDGDGIGVVHPAWAYDAAGQPVPTRFEIDGSKLTQLVDHQQADVTYPVVADPTVSVGWYWYVRFSRTEVRRIWDNRTTIYATANALCVLIPNAALKAVCIAYIAYNAWVIYDTLQAAARYGQCIELKYTTWVNPITMLPYLNGVCRYSC